MRLNYKVYTFSWVFMMFFYTVWIRSGYASYTAPFAATGGPIIQYNTQTHQKKAIAFLASFYNKTYKYQMTKIYGVALTPDNGTLFAVSNGNFVNGARYPSVLSISIPASERM